MTTGQTSQWTADTTCGMHAACDAFQGSQTTATCCTDPCWVMVGATWVHNSGDQWSNTCGETVTCGTCTGGRICCENDVPYRCLLASTCNL